MNSKTALIIIDIQNDYFENGANPLVNSEIAAENTQKVLNYFRKMKCEVVHVQHHAARPGATFFVPKTNGVLINESVKPLNNEIVITKYFPNSFRNTNLLEYLQNLGIEKLVFCGMMTQMCVDASVRAAKDFGFECVVISDAVATKDLTFDGSLVPASMVQTAFLAGLNYFYAEIKSADQFINNQ